MNAITAYCARAAGKIARMAALCAWMTVLAAGLFASSARAQVCGPDCGCVIAQHLQTAQVITEENLANALHIDAEFSEWVQFLEDVMWEQYLEPAFEAMTDEATTVAMNQLLIFGAFMDAKIQMGAQRDLQELRLRTHKDYVPSSQICRLAHGVHSLGATEFNINVTATQLTEWMLRRATGNVNVSASEGETIDRGDRLAKFRERYCLIYDNGFGLDQLCPASLAGFPIGGSPTNPMSTNQDVDYGWVVERGGVLTLDDMWVYGGPLTTGPPLGMVAPPGGSIYVPWENVMALASNLYGHRVPPRLPETAFHQLENQKRILDIRSVIAKRSVATASFTEIIGLKSFGSAGAYTYNLQHIIENLRQFGFNTADTVIKYALAPSYYAQMEFLTKKMFQDAQFYVNLYEKPANVERQKVVLQSFGLMQDFDTLQSYLRTEVMLSVILELEIIKIQARVQNDINRVIREGESG